MARQTYVKFLTIKIFFGSLVWLFTKSVEQKTVHRPDLVSLWPVKPTSDFFLKIFRVSGLALYSQECGTKHFIKTVHSVGLVSRGS